MTKRQVGDEVFLCDDRKALRAVGIKSAPGSRGVIYNIEGIMMHVETDDGGAWYVTEKYLRPVSSVSSPVVSLGGYTSIEDIQASFEGSSSLGWDDVWD
jgi:hypothetical protein